MRLALPLFLALSSLSTAAATAATAAPAHPAAAPVSVLPFIEDDFATARQRALGSKRLLVVDAWAAWCHTCLSMRNFVFTDPRLRPVADRFVYLAIDTENPRNADFVARFPIQSWPTLLVLDPAAQNDGSARVLARFTGAMTAPELLSRLEELGRATSAEQVPLGEADAAAAAGHWAAAAVLYARAAARTELRPRARLGQIQSLRRLGQSLACAELADAAHDEVGRSAIATDFFSYGSLCLDSVPDVDTRQRLRQKLRGYLEAVVTDPRAPLLPDDRSDGYGTLTELADTLGDQAGGDHYTEARLQLLEAAAAQATNPVAAATYDAHRLECYRRLKRYPPAEAMLLGSEKALPGDYNPPARLARLYFEMGRLDDALPRIDRALRLAKGPRRVSMLELKAGIQHGLGQTRPAIASLEEALRLAQPSSPTAEALRTKAAELRKNIEALQRTLDPQPGPTPHPRTSHPRPRVAGRETAM